MTLLGKADANPTKAFFVWMITRDISLEDCILDLIDNSVDGAWRLEGSLMSRVGSKDTGPEVATRKKAHRLGLRFRLYRGDLPGKPDMVFPRLSVALFVHGCFWHRHPGCKKASSPSTRRDFWTAKFEKNVERDARVSEELQNLGWEPVVVWECETKSDLALTRAIVDRVLADRNLTKRRVRQSNPRTKEANVKVTLSQE